MILLFLGCAFRTIFARQLLSLLRSASAMFPTWNYTPTQRNKRNMSWKHFAGPILAASALAAILCWLGRFDTTTDYIDPAPTARCR